jgi:hypothetical protein
VRTPSTLWKLLKNSGGLYTVLFFLGYLLAWHYSTTAMQRDLISSLYLVEDGSTTEDNHNEDNGEVVGKIREKDEENQRDNS